MELAMVINKKMFSSVEFFHGKDREFLTWIAHALKPVKFNFRDVIFRESDLANESKMLQLNQYSLLHLERPGGLRPPQVHHQDLSHLRRRLALRPPGVHRVDCLVRWGGLPLRHPDLRSDQPEDVCALKLQPVGWPRGVCPEKQGDQKVHCAMLGPDRDPGAIV
jgi:hypothetical protein